MAEKTEKHSEPHPGKPPRKRHFLAWLILLLVCGIMALPLFYRQGKAPTGGPPSGSIGTGAELNAETARTGSMDIFLDALGTVTPEHTVSVYSQVSGRVLAVHYKEGQYVRTGELLVEIDPRTIEAQLRQTQGLLTRDRAALDQAKVNLKRYQEAFQKNAVAQQTVFDQEATVRQYEGTVQNDEGSVEYYNVQLGYCRITAPISGRIGLRLVDPGNTVFSGSSSTIAVITQLNPITVVFSVAEDSLARVRRGMAVGQKLRVDLYDRGRRNKLATGQLLTFDNQVDTTTGTVRLRAVFKNDKEELFPNQFVNVRLHVDTLEKAVLIPTVAIQYNGQQAFIYKILSDRTVKIHNVTVVNSEQKDSAVEGLASGERVAVSNFDRLYDGAAVSIAGEKRAGGSPGK